MAGLATWCTPPKVGHHGSFSVRSDPGATSPRVGAAAARHPGLDRRRRARDVRIAVELDLRIAFVGTYPPRRCGIATFTRDLAAGMTAANQRVKPLVVAVNDEAGPYEYPEEVEYQIR